MSDFNGGAPSSSSLSNVKSIVSGCFGWGKWVVGSFFGVLVIAGIWMWVRESVTAKSRTSQSYLSDQQNQSRLQALEAQRQREIEATKVARYRQEQLQAHEDSHYISDPENTAWYHKPRSSYCFPAPDRIRKVFNNHDECYLNIQRFREYIDKGYACCTKNRFMDFSDRNYPCCGGGASNVSNKNNSWSASGGTIDQISAA